MYGCAVGAYCVQEHMGTIGAYCVQEHMGTIGAYCVQEHMGTIVLEVVDNGLICVSALDKPDVSGIGN